MTIATLSILPSMANYNSSLAGYYDEVGPPYDCGNIIN
jgi:hypothetical protein